MKIKSCVLLGTFCVVISFLLSVIATMINLRNAKVLQNCVIKNRVKNNRESTDIFQFYATDHIIYDVLPTGENIINFYIHEKKKKLSKSSIINKITKDLGEIWRNYIIQMNLSVQLLSERQIKTQISELLDKWQNMQKNVKRQSASKEKDFVEAIKKILNIAKGEHKMFFNSLNCKLMY